MQEEDEAMDSLSFSVGRSSQYIIYELPFRWVQSRPQSGHSRLLGYYKDNIKANYRNRITYTA